MRKREVALFIEDFCADIALFDLWSQVDRECRKAMAVGVSRASRAQYVANACAMCQSRRDDWRPLLRVIADSEPRQARSRYDWYALRPCSRATINEFARDVRELVKAPWQEMALRAIWWARAQLRTRGTDTFAYSFAMLIVILARDPRNFTIAQLSGPIEYEPGCSREFAQICAMGAPLDVARTIMYRAGQCADVRAHERIMTQTQYARLLVRDIDPAVMSRMQVSETREPTVLDQPVHACGPMSIQSALEVINIWTIKCILEVPCARKPIIARDADGAIYACESICAHGITSTRATLSIMRKADARLREMFVLLCLWRAVMGFSISASVGIMVNNDISDIYCFGEVSASPIGDRVTSYAHRAVFDAFMREGDHDRYCATVRKWCVRLVQLARETTDMPEYAFAPCARTLQACAIRAQHVCDVWSTTASGGTN